MNKEIGCDSRKVERGQTPTGFVSRVSGVLSKSPRELIALYVCSKVSLKNSLPYGY